MWRCARKGSSVSVMQLTFTRMWFMYLVMGEGEMVLFFSPLKYK